jgi:hypothetical protein
MAETYTPQPESQKPSDDHFAAIQEMQQLNAAAAAQRLIEQPAALPALPQEATQDREPSPRVQRNRRIARNVVGGVVGAGVAATLVAGGVSALAPAEFSEATTTWTAESGDGLYDAAEEIKGINREDIRDGVDFIQTYPANIDALKDGLQQGEQLIIPVSVEGYEDK